MTVYENRIVAYVDIMGFKELVNNGNAEKILAILNSVNERQVTLDALGRPIELSMFSDCMLFSSLLDQEFRIIQLVGYVQHVVASLMINGIWCRGAVTIGELYHRNPLAFGPALINAYELENKSAYYPRIIISDEIVDRYTTCERQMRGEFAAHEREIFRKDSDGIKHLEIFSPRSALPLLAGANGTLGDIVIKPTLKLVHAELSKHTDPRIRQKLAWLITYITDTQQTLGGIKFSSKQQPKVSGL